MKPFTIALLVTSLFLPDKQVMAQQNNPNYDAKLAAKLGADDYGMKSFYLVILKSGNNKTTDTEKKRKAFRGHLDNINRLVADKKLIVAGPLAKNDKAYRGIFILDVSTEAQALELLKTDPAINADYLQADMYQWYGSAALAEYLPASDKVWKINP
ncbi:YciI family protein [Colwelliaceae bacterium 6441]